MKPTCPEKALSDGPNVVPVNRMGGFSGGGGALSSDPTPGSRRLGVVAMSCPMLPRDRDLCPVEGEALLETGRRVLRQEGEELLRAAGRVGDEMVEAARRIAACDGRLVVSGLGKSGLIGRRSPHLRLVGDPSFSSRHRGSHGDLGMVCRGRGPFPEQQRGAREVLELLPFFQHRAPIIAMTGENPPVWPKSGRVPLPPWARGGSLEPGSHQ